jgi:hypothetical protein
MEVDQDDLGLQRGDRADALPHVAGLAHHVEPRHRPQRDRERAPERGVVVDQVKPRGFLRRCRIHAFHLLLLSHP